MKADNHDSKITEGTILEKDDKKFVVIGWDILNAGHTKEFNLIRLYKNWNPLIRMVKQVYDREICEYNVVKY